MRYRREMTKVSNMTPHSGIVRVLKKYIGVDEVFQVIARKLVERRAEIERVRGYAGGGGEYGDSGGTRDGMRIDASLDSNEKKGGGRCC